jgi:hypothetical protein
MPVTRPIIDRLMAKLSFERGCWIFRGALTKGYGAIGGGGRHGGPRYAHRVAYEELVGPIPDGLHIDHLCREPRCCNPMHLEPVPHGENILRGNTWAAKNAAKTHCVNGHAFDEANTDIWHGQRKCKQCNRDRQRGYYRAKTKRTD